MDAKLKKAYDKINEERLDCVRLYREDKTRQHLVEMAFAYEIALSFLIQADRGELGEDAE